MFVNTNLAAIFSSDQLSNTQDALSKDLQQLSSGLRINSSADDAAGLAISQRMQGQLGGFGQATRNAQDGISLIQTADSAMSTIGSILQRMRTLTVQATNATNITSDRSKIVTEMTQLHDDINRIASQTQFNTQALMFKGSFSGRLFHVGANSNQTISLSIGTMVATGAVIKLTLSKITSMQNGLLTQQAKQAESLLANIDSAIDAVSSQRATLGAKVNRLNFAIGNMQTAMQNLSAANARITNVDMASEMVDFSKNQILQQAGTSMLAQSNAMPQTILKLLG